MIKPKIGVIGIGMVGGALKKYFETRGFKRGQNLFCFDTDPKKGCADDIRSAEIIFICVPTPSGSDGSCDTSIIEGVVKKYARSSKVMVIKSTVIPGTTEMLAKKYNCALIFSPEFLTEARVWENMMNPDRQIVAPTAKAKLAAWLVLELLPPAPFTSPRRKKAENWAEMNPTEAEIGKYAANTFGALKVSFANTIYDFAKMLEKFMNKKGLNLKVNYDNIRKVMAHDPRIGDYWLDVSHGSYRGYGGYCFPKDTDALIAYGRKIIKQIPKSGKRLVFEKGLKILESMKAYNEALLYSQGLTLKKVSRHDKELAKLIKKNYKNQHD